MTHRSGPRVRRAHLVAVLALLSTNPAGAETGPDLLRQAHQLRRQGHLRSAEALYRRHLGESPEDPASLFGLGQLLLDEHRYREAEQLFRNLSARFGRGERHAASLVGLGRALSGRGGPGQAERVLRRARADPAHGGEATANLALALEAQGKMHEAARAWEQYLDRHADVPRARRHRDRARRLAGDIGRSRSEAKARPGDAAVRLRLGRLLEQAGDVEGAAEVLDGLRPSAASPGGDPRFRRGQLLLKAGREKEARRALREHLREYPQHPSALYALAAAEASSGDRAAEAAVWQAVLAVRPDDLFAARGLFRALSLVGELEAAIQGLRFRAHAEPEDPIPRVLLGLALEAADRPDPALHALLDALEHEPNDNAVLEAVREHLEGRPARLARAMAELARRAGRSPPALRARGALRILFGDPKGGAADLEAFLGDPPEDVRGLVALAFARRSLGQPDEAARLLERAVDLAPAYPFARLDLAALRLHQGDPTEAVRQGRKALDLLPVSPLGHTIVGAALLAADQVQQALRQLGRGLALDPVDPSGRLLPLALRAFQRAGDLESARDLLRWGVPVEPERLYRMAWRHLRDSYLSDDFDTEAWLSWKDRFRGQLVDAASAHAAIGEMAASLDDPHTRLLTPVQSRDRLLVERGERLELDPDGSVTPGSPTLLWTLLEDGIVYLRLTSLRDPNAAGAVEAALESFPDAPEVVLDLRGNPGGYEGQADRIADLLVPEGTVVARRSTRSGEEIRRAGGSTASGVRVKVLVDRRTASAAEHLADQLRAGGEAEVIGMPTTGKQVAQFPYILPDGWMLLVTAARIEPVPPGDGEPPPPR